MTTIRRQFEGPDGPVTVECAARGGERFEVRIGEALHLVDAHRAPDGTVAVRVAGRRFVAAVAPAGAKGALHVRIDGRTWLLKPHVGGRGGAAAAGTGVLEAPMTGTVLAVHVAVGDAVTKGDTVAVVTAMKMEHKIVADQDGTVAEVGAREGDTVEQGAVLVRIEPAAP